MLLRTVERRYLGTECAETVVVSRPDGTQVRPQAPAEVRDAFRETDAFARLGGKPAAMVKVFRAGEQKPTEISRPVKAYGESRAAVEGSAEAVGPVVFSVPTTVAAFLTIVFITGSLG